MRTIFMILLIQACVVALPQDSVEKKKSVSFTGYIKDLQWVRFEKDFSNATATNLVHNRINTKWTPSRNLSSALEIRNRFYWGDDVRNLPNFKNQLRNENEAVNLSARWFDSRSAVLHTNVERLWLEFRQPKWNVRAGRQRINWGITNTWNPNDLFNTYNFLDFDNEERPGSDAVKGQYLLNDLSHIELAFANNGDRSILAGKYSTNVSGYDLQVNAGLYQDVFTAGFGWAGSIKDVGFKGELQYYAGSDSGVSNILITIEADYIFENGWYLSSALLYNETGLSQPLEDPGSLVFRASPRNLMPTKWNILVITSKEITPLFNASMSVVYSPGTNLLILFPTLRYNLRTNWDLDFVWQSFFAEMVNFSALSHNGFLRLRWSF